MADDEHGPGFCVILGPESLRVVISSLMENLAGYILREHSELCVDRRRVQRRRSVQVSFGYSLAFEKPGDASLSVKCGRGACAYPAYS